MNWAFAPFMAVAITSTPAIPNLSSVKRFCAAQQKGGKIRKPARRERVYEACADISHMPMRAVVLFGGAGLFQLHKCDVTTLP
jgi:hypothetical protein